MVMLGDGRVGVEHDVRERRLVARDGARVDAVPDLQDVDLRDVRERAHVPIGCQTVFSSRNAEISYSDCVSGCPRTTRLTFSAAATSSSARRPSAPVRSIAFTSMWLASQGASSPRRPVTRVEMAPRG